MISDEELCHEMQSGSEAALEALVRRYHSPIFSYISRLMQDETTAQDLTQETFIRVCTKIQQYNYPEPFRPWIYRIALNLCRDYWKSAHHRQCQRTTSLPPEQPDTVSNVANIYDWQETRTEVQQAVLKLNQIYRDVLILRFYQELKLSEIADVLQLPLGTVKWRLFQALKLVKRALQKGGLADGWTREGND